MGLSLCCGGRGLCGSPSTLAATGGGPGGGSGFIIPVKNIRELTIPVPVEHPSKLFSAEGRRTHLARLSALSARQQEVFALRYVDEWSTEEVAEMLGITTGSVKRYLFRAVHHLRRALRDRR